MDHFASDLGGSLLTHHEIDEMHEPPSIGELRAVSKRSSLRRVVLRRSESGSVCNRGVCSKLFK